MPKDAATALEQLNHVATAANLRSRVGNITSLSEVTPKHNLNVDFGYPDVLGFTQFYTMYDRHGAAAAAVDKTVLKTWEDLPTFAVEGTRDEETPEEAALRQHLQQIHFWPKFIEADRRSLVGSYGAVLLRVADNGKWSDPLNLVTNGIEALVDVIPVWENQLKPQDFDTDVASETYGLPKYYMYHEAAGDHSTSALQQKVRSFTVHPDRVLLLSRTGDLYSRSLLRPGYNSLLDMQKVAGGSGEGFYRNARQSIKLKTDSTMAEIAQAMNVSLEELHDKLDKQVQDWLKGFDSILAMQKMDAEVLQTTLPSPEHHFLVALQMFASSIPIPLKVLVGSQSGERASTEDAKEWSQTINARRVTQIVPTLERLLSRMAEVNMVSDASWQVQWSDLTETKPEERLNRAKEMMAINKQAVDMGEEPIFTLNEIRIEAGKEPLGVEYDA